MFKVYVQWLRSDARASFMEEGLKRSTNPLRIYDFSFFPVNRTFESVTAAKTIRYAKLDPQGSLRPPTIY